MRHSIALLAVVLIAACTFDVGPDPAVEDPEDAGSWDVGARDAGRDAGSVDAAEADASEPVDAGRDAGTDAGEPDAGDPDAGPSCDTRVAEGQWRPCRGDGFVPDTPTEDWQHTSTAILVVTQGAPRHRGIDTVVNPGQDQLLIGKFAYGAFDKDLVDEKVEIWIERACGEWTRYGTVNTSNEGQNGNVAGVEDDGGRVFFSIPEAERLAPGSYRVKMLVKGDHSEANFWLHVWEPGMRVVVSDIDGTITTRENDGLWTAFDPSSPTPRDGAADVFRVYAAKGYRVVFLTARPEFMTGATRGWFSDRSFPEAIFHLSQSNIGVQGADAQAYKAGFLESLIQGEGVVVEWAYGNKESDLDAYLSVGIEANHIRIVAGEYSGDLKGALGIDGYVPELDPVGCLAPVEQ